METTVGALYVHGEHSSQPEDTTPTPMLALDRVHAEAGRGIKEDRRFFRPVLEGRDRKRQVSLIDRGTIARLEAQFGPLDERFIKSQVVLEDDLFLPDLISAVLEFEDGAELTVALERDPCFAMDLIVPGLRAAMDHGQQGALARVTRSGALYVGQRVTVRIPAGAER